MDAFTATALAAGLTWSATAAGAALIFVLPRLPRLGMGVVLGLATVLMGWAAVSGLLLPAAQLAVGRIGAVAGLASVLAALAGGALAVSAIRRRLSALSDHRPVVGRQMFLVMTLHHLPEGMAVGLSVSAAMSGDATAMAGSIALVVAMAAHNVAEGALVSLPLREEGMSRGGAWMRGQLSGLAEVAGAMIGALAMSVAAAVLPWALAAAGGAMMAVVLGDLLPELRRMVSRHAAGPAALAG